MVDISPSPMPFFEKYKRALGKLMPFANLWDRLEAPFDA
jgi:hypothetical protein